MTAPAGAADSAPSLPPGAKEPGPAASWDRWLVAAVALGIAVRLRHVITTDFPVNDGGLFYVMIEAVRAHRYVLPETVQYGLLEVPFAYPPLGFYFAALIADLTGLSTLSSLRWLPFAGCSAGLVAFAWFARTYFVDRVAAVAAAVAFALLPAATTWLIMGGGITRSFGQLFAILMLHQLLQLFRRPSLSTFLLAVVCSALTVLSHPESTSMLAAAALLMTIAFGRTWIAYGSALLVAAGTLLLSAPWWVTTLARYGPDTYRGASLDAPFRHLPGGIVVGLLSLSIPLLACLISPRMFVPAWVASVYLLTRGTDTYSAYPMSLMAGVAVAWLIAAQPKTRTEDGTDG